ncbi:MAG TPA: transglycosylase SLT domain-containing protein [Dermatophilaceae bacterium]|nr:transglycosylase SLT domain-containing protein [Dermatophilaceae bacterium]
MAIARWSRNYAVPADLVTAVIWHESLFRPDAVSRTNDYGLMQLHGKPGLTPNENVEVGVYKLKCLLQSAKGVEAVALARYNGGPAGDHSGRCRNYAKAVLALAQKVRTARKEGVYKELENAAPVPADLSWHRPPSFLTQKLREQVVW